jgi:hypothetical protein
VFVVGAACAVLGGLAAGGAVAVAQGDAEDDTFYACALGGKWVRPQSIWVNKQPTCGLNQRVVSWNEQGPEGPPGPPGPPGSGGATALVATTIGHPTGDYYDAVLRLDPGTWLVEGSADRFVNLELDAGEANRCVLSVLGGATMENQVYSWAYELVQQALVTVPEDDPDGLGEVVYSCRANHSGATDFPIQLTAIPATIQDQP